jgi:type VI secretion system protein VasG
MISVDIRSLLNRLNRPCTQAVEAAAGSCLARQHYEVTVEHVLAQLLESPSGDTACICRHFNVDREAWARSLAAILEKHQAGNSGKPVFSPLFLEWLQEAWLSASVDFGQESIRSGALIAALLLRPERLSGSPLERLIRFIPRERLMSEFSTITLLSDEGPKAGEPAEKSPAGGPGSALDQYGSDYTAKARAGKVDPVFGRDREISQMIDILARRRKNNPILVGEAGVGKTAVVEGLALRISQGKVPDSLKDVSIVGLDMGLLQAGAGVQGEFERRMKSVIQEIKSSPRPLILFIDEAHTLIGAGAPAGGSDAANLLKPALARGELRTIAATTWSEYKRYFEKDPALARRFQPVKLDEPTVEQAVRILRGLKQTYEEAHGVMVRDSAIVAAAEYSSRYLTGRQLPDKAVDLLDTSAARVKGQLTAMPPALEEKQREIEWLEREKEALNRDALQGEKPPAGRLDEIEASLLNLRPKVKNMEVRWLQERDAVGRLIGLRKQLMDGFAKGENAENLLDLRRAAAKADNDLRKLQGGQPLVMTDVDADAVAQVVSDWTGIPLGKVLRDEGQTLKNLHENLARRIRGQDAAVQTISEILRASKAGLRDPEKPLGVFLLVGPSGVGKTETALAMGDLLFGGERFLHTINMSEFRESHSVSRLIGSPPGYVGYGEGGVLTEAVRKNPYSVVLIDEVEKGHLDVLNLFYQVFDKGQLSDGEGRNIDFRNTVIFLTSNLASNTLLQQAEAGTRSAEDMIAAIRPELARHFKPALLARMTIVPYWPLDASCLQELVRIRLKRLAGQLQERHALRLSWSDAILNAIAARCREVDSGARNIDHVLNGSLLPQLSAEIVSRLGSSADSSNPEGGFDLDVEADGAFSVTFRPSLKFVKSPVDGRCP